MDINEIPNYILHATPMTVGEMKPLGKIVSMSTELEENDASAIVPTKSDFSFSFECPTLPKWFVENAEIKPVKEAQVMLVRLRDYQALWRKYYGCGMRRERRQIERNFNRLARLFVFHCRRYGISITKARKESSDERYY